MGGVVAKDHEFPIVGIGASAGGVEALEGLFRAMAEDTGMAFVLVTHMPRGHTTTLPEIIGRYTEMTARNVRHDETIEPNHVYVCPADQVVTIVDGRLILEARTSDVQRKRARHQGDQGTRRADAGARRGRERTEAKQHAGDRNRDRICRPHPSGRRHGGPAGRVRQELS